MVNEQRVSHSLLKVAFFNPLDLMLLSDKIDIYMSELLNLNQFSERCGVKLPSVVYQVKRGNIKTVTVQKESVMIPESEVEIFKKSLKTSRHYEMWQKKAR